MNIAIWLARSAQRFPDREALFLGQTAVARYGEFHARAMSVAGWLQAQGIVAGDRVGLFLKNTPDYLIAQYGIWYAGAVAVPINAKLHGKEAAWILDNAGARMCFASAGMDAAVKAAGADAQVVSVGGPDWQTALEHPGAGDVAARGPDDLAWLFYTSGTTGKPKGVMITHRMLQVMALSYFADVDEVRAEDAALYAAPLSHGAGIYNLMHVMRGARHVLPPSGGFDPAEIFALARHFGSTHMFAAPTMVKRLVQAAKEMGVRGDGLRTIVYAGGPMYLADIEEAVATLGDIFVQVYGQGECPMGITALSRQEVSDRTHPNWQARLGSVGRAQSAVDVAIAAQDGGLLPAGASGEILVRGDVVMPGYWNNPEATAKTLRDGWLWTGDMGFMDADGYVTMQDRSKDLIISGGTNIYPREVEEAILTHSDVSEVSVIGRPDPDWGEDVVAFVVLNEGCVLDPAALDAHCLAQIARFKRPKAYFALPELPKNNYGKVLKTELRAQLAAMQE